GGEPTVDIKWHKAGQLSETLVLGEDYCVILEVSNCWCAETHGDDSSSSSSSSNDNPFDRGKRFAPCAAWRVMGFVPGGRWIRQNENYNSSVPSAKVSRPVQACVTLAYYLF
ncbi:unnamed protein product, partial [Pylaiella littoralis]